MSKTTALVTTHVRNAESARRAFAEQPEVLAVRCRKMLKKRALTAAAASVIPVPGLGMAVDIVLLSKLLEDISAEFGLSKAQIDSLPTAQRTKIFGVVQSAGNLVIGKLITGAVVAKLLAAVGMRVGAKEASRWVPLVGQAASATLGYVLTKKLGEQHVADCLEMRRTLDRMRTAS